MAVAPSRGDNQPAVVPFFEPGEGCLALVAAAPTGGMEYEHLHTHHRSAFPPDAGRGAGIGPPLDPAGQRTRSAGFIGAHEITLPFHAKPDARPRCCCLGSDVHGRDHMSNGPEW